MVFGQRPHFGAFSFNNKDNIIGRQMTVGVGKVLLFESIISHFIYIYRCTFHCVFIVG